MRITLSLVAAIGFFAATQRAEAQTTTTGQPATVTSTVQILPSTTYQPTTTMMTSSEPTRRGLFGRRLARRGSSMTPTIIPSAPMPAFAPMTMPSTTTTEEKKPESGVKTASGTTTEGAITTAGFSTTPGATQGTIIPAGATMMSSNGVITMMPAEMMSTTTVTKSVRRGLIGRLRR